MEKIDVKDLMDERYKYWKNKKTLGLEKALDFYCVYRYLNARDDAPSDFIDDVFLWAHTDYNVNKFLATLDIDWNINRKPAIQLNSTNVLDFLEAIEQQYPKHVKKRAMEARAKSLLKNYNAWLDEHSPQMRMSLSAVASLLDEAGIEHEYVLGSRAEDHPYIKDIRDNVDEAVDGYIMGVLNEKAEGSNKNYGDLGYSSLQSDDVKTIKANINRLLTLINENPMALKQLLKKYPTLRYTVKDFGFRFWLARRGFQTYFSETSVQKKIIDKVFGPAEAFVEKDRLRVTV